MRSMTALLLISLMIIVTAPSAHADETVMIQVSHGILLKVRNAERVVVAAPDIADVNLITRNELMVIAKKIGETTISVWDARGFTTYRVVVANAPGGDIARAISEALREPSITVKLVGDAVTLEGSVKTSADKARAQGIAEAFGKKVVNLLTVEQPAVQPPSATQVMEAQVREALKDLPVVIKVIRDDTILIEGTVANQTELVRLEAIAKAFAKNVVLLVRVRNPLQIRVDTSFVEIDRQALQQMGVEWGGGNLTDLLTDPFAFHFGFFVDQNNQATALQLLVARLRLLEQRGAARTLANPRAVVMEGRPGKLVVGGELPVPIVQGDGRTVTIQFKEFGIRLEFCVNSILRKQGDQLDCVRTQEFGAGDGVTMDLNTEVSSLDFTNAITAAGFVIPTIKKRQVQTMVMMRPGEFLLLGGLIQRDVSQNISKIPVLGDIPVLGALFRSVRFQRGETELVIFVSPSAITPTREAPPVPAEPSPAPSPAP